MEIEDTSNLSSFLPSSSATKDVESVDLPLIVHETSYSDIKADLQFCMTKSGQLCFLQSQKFAADLLSQLSKVKMKGKSESSYTEEDISDHPDYLLTRNAMMRYQYGEAVLYTKRQKANFAKYPLLRFLYFYNRYLHGQAEQIQNAEGPLAFASQPETEKKYLMVLREELKREEIHSSGLDPYLGYLYGTILRQLGLLELATEKLVNAVCAEPRIWCFWFELADALLAKDDLDAIFSRLPRHWMRDFFLARVYVHFNLSDEALCALKYLRKGIFANTSYLLVELARTHLIRRDLAESVKLMEKVRTAEPGRLEDMDFYSIVLYLKGDKSRLAKLIRDLNEQDPFAPETNFAIAHYYSLREQHDKSVEHLALALRCYPETPQGWLAMGHEYTDIGNLSRAIMCYQKALEVNPRDYKAYYGLGKAYESEEDTSMAAYYYQKSVKFSGSDLRPYVALGNLFVKLNRTEDAARVYWQAYLLGEKDDGTIVKLAKLYDTLGERTKALTAFERAVELYEEVGAKMKEENFRNFAADLGRGHMLLAEAYLQDGRVAEAKDLAKKATTFSAVIDEARSFLKKFDGEQEGSMMTDASVLSGDDMDMSVVDMTQASAESLISDDDENLS